MTVAAAGERTVTFQDDGDGVGPEALPSRTESLVFRCRRNRGVSVNFHLRLPFSHLVNGIIDITGVAGGAQFTGVSPGSSQRTATGSARHAHADL